MITSMLRYVGFEQEIHIDRNIRAKGAAVCIYNNSRSAVGNICTSRY